MLRHGMLQETYLTRLMRSSMLEIVNEMTVEIEGQERPACVAESVLRVGF